MHDWADFVFHRQEFHGQFAQIEWSHQDKPMTSTLKRAFSVSAVTIQQIDVFVG